jgi:hypothetical protein
MGNQVAAAIPILRRSAVRPTSCKEREKRGTLARYSGWNFVSLIS